VYFGVYNIMCRSVCVLYMTIIEEGKGSRVGSVYFVDSGCRRRKKIIEKADRNFVREGGIRKKYRDNGF